MAAHPWLPVSVCAILSERHEVAGVCRSKRISKKRWKSWIQQREVDVWINVVGCSIGRRQWRFPDDSGVGVFGSIYPRRLITTSRHAGPSSASCHRRISVMNPIHNSIKHFGPNLRYTSHHSSPASHRVEIHPPRIALARTLLNGGWKLYRGSNCVPTAGKMSSNGLAAVLTCVGSSLNVSALSKVSVPTSREGICT